MTSFCRYVLCACTSSDCISLSIFTSTIQCVPSSSMTMRSGVVFTTRTVPENREIVDLQPHPTRNGRVAVHHVGKRRALGSGASRREHLNRWYPRGRTVLTPGHPPSNDTFPTTG